MFVIKCKGSDNRYIRVQNNLPVIVTDIKKATIFNTGEAEKYIHNQMKKSMRNTVAVVGCTDVKNTEDALKLDTVSELQFVKDDIRNKLSQKKNKCSEKLQYYDDMILDIRHYIRDDKTKLNACQAAKVLYKLQKIERCRADVKRELQRIQQIFQGIDDVIKTANNFKYDDYKPRVIHDMSDFLGK